MKVLRILLGILAIIPLVLLADKILFRATEYDEHLLRTVIYLALGVPILILNVWVWVYPETIEFYFFGKKNQDN